MLVSTGNASYQAAFQCVKNAVVSDPTLQYFDAFWPKTVQIDASQVELGAALLQDNKPVAFTSKVLTEVEHYYANIKYEMLAVVFRAVWFRTYVYGRPFTIEIDHKPLELITQKSLADTPAWLQCMLLCLQGYDYILHYCSGKEMVLLDTPSCFKPKLGPEITLDIAIHHACLSPVWKEALQLAFEVDVETCALDNIIISGWPSDTHLLHPYWQHSLLKMDLCSVEKPSSSLHQKGRRSLVHCTSHTEASPKHSCLPVVGSSGLVLTRPLRKLFGNVKCVSDFRSAVLLHHWHWHLHLHIPGRYVHQIFSHWMV